MTDTLYISKYNNVHAKIHTDSGIAYELSDHFTFNVPGAKFSPQYKNKVWDGKIRLYNTARRTLYLGLVPVVESFAKARGYRVEYTEPNDFANVQFTLNDAEQFVSKLKLPITPRDYQLEAFTHAVRHRRSILISPTASGKSLIIYLLARLYQRNNVLIIVPNISLVRQLSSDFINDYGCPPELIHQIYTGQEKHTDAPFTITTWQSIFRLPEKWFEKYGAVIGDEVHTFKAKSLVTIMEHLKQCKYRFGLTGTLDGTQTNQMVLEGLFGPVKVVTTTSQLMEQNTVATLSIKAILLSHSDDARKAFKGTYKDELSLLANHKERNKFLVSLTLSLKGNTMLLFNTIKHGILLESMLKQADPNREVYLVYGAVDGDTREEIRKLVETKSNAVIVASYKTFATGTNIKNLHNVIFGVPSKSRVRVLQSIGRALRTHSEKVEASLYDVADDLSWLSRKNITLQHFSERIQMYNQEKFEYKIFTIKLKRAT